MAKKTAEIRREALAAARRSLNEKVECAVGVTTAWGDIERLKAELEDAYDSYETALRSAVDIMSRSELATLSGLNKSQLRVRPKRKSKDQNEKIADVSSDSETSVSDKVVNLTVEPVLGS